MRAVIYPLTGRRPVQDFESDFNLARIPVQSKEIESSMVAYLLPRHLARGIQFSVNEYLFVLGYGDLMISILERKAPFALFSSR
jgi:hypothetical protein